jgi:phospholipase/carboxylesterase
MSSLVAVPGALYTARVAFEGARLVGADEHAVLETVERETAPEPAASVVWLHGLGADGYDFDPIVPALRLPGGPEVRYVFPHAPVRPVTINGGVEMRAWYDIVTCSAARHEDEAGIRESSEAVAALIRREAERGIPAHRVVLAGFSQGGAIALHAGLRTRRGSPASSPVDLPAAARQLPASSTRPTGRRRSSWRTAASTRWCRRCWARKAPGCCRAGYDVQFKSYTMPHSVCPEEVEDIRRWMGRTLRGPLPPLSSAATAGRGAATAPRGRQCSAASFVERQRRHGSPRPDAEHPAEERQLRLERAR